LQENDGAEPEQDPAQQPRHIARAHAQRGADRIVAREKQPERRDADEHEPGDHVLACHDALRAGTRVRRRGVRPFGRHLLVPRYPLTPVRSRRWEFRGSPPPLVGEGRCGASLSYTPDLIAAALNNAIAKYILLCGFDLDLRGDRLPGRDLAGEPGFG